MALTLTLTLVPTPKPKPNPNKTISRLVGRMNSSAQKVCNELVKEVKKRPGQVRVRVRVRVLGARQGGQEAPRPGER